MRRQFPVAVRLQRVRRAGLKGDADKVQSARSEVWSCADRCSRREAKEGARAGGGRVDEQGGDGGKTSEKDVLIITLFYISISVCLQCFATQSTLAPTLRGSVARYASTARVPTNDSLDPTWRRLLSPGRET